MYVRGKHSPKKHALNKTKDNTSLVAGNVLKQKENKDGELHQNNDDKEITLPVFKMVDAQKYLQCFSTIISRDKEEGVGMEDLDKLQMELEILLSSVVLRQKTLHSEIELITAAEETKPKKTANLPVAKTKRFKKYEDRNESENVEPENDDDKSLNVINITKEDEEKEESVEELKESTIRHPPKRSIPLVPPSVVPVSRNDITNKFWAMVEQYCSEITLENIKFLEDLIKSHEIYEKGEYKTIPPLGTHYSERWSETDTKDEKEISSWSKSDSDINEAGDIKDIDTFSKVCVPGPMVQRLVSALVEENPSSSSNAIKRGRLDAETDENCSQPSFKRSKDMELNGFISINNEYSDFETNYRMLPFYHNSHCFEKKIRKELEAIGFLDPANESNQDDTDEVLTELNRCTEELDKVAVTNKKILIQLLHKAKTEFKRQQIKNQIKLINSEIADINMKNMSLKLKRKHLCKKEAEDAWKLLKEREQLLKKLEEIS